jgi:predicted MFS family arabinose efflux permease
MALSGGRVAGSLFILKNGELEALVGIFMALFSTIPVVTSLSVGRWVDRSGPAKIMRLGVALVMIGAWLPVFKLSVPILFLTAITVGCGFNFMSVAAQHTVGHLVSNVSTSERMANFGWFALGHSASSTIGPFITGFMIDGFGFKAAFAVLAAASCISGYLVLTRSASLPRDTRPSQKKGTQDVLDLLKTKSLRRIYLVNMVMSASWDLFIVMLPILGYRMGYSASVIGTVFSLFAAGTFAARAAMPWLSKRAFEWQILRAALVVVVAVFCFFPWASAAPLLMLGGLVFGCAVGLSQPNFLSLLHASAPPGRGGEAVGLRSVLSNSVSIAVPLAFGAAIIPFGLTPILLSGALMFSFGLWPAHKAVKNQV